MVSDVITLLICMSDWATHFSQVSKWVEDTDELTLLHIIRQEFIKKRPSLQYSDMYTTSIISQSGNDVLVSIDNPVSVILQVT